MSDLLPNVTALIDELTGSSTGAQDARALAEAAATASTVEELDKALNRIAVSWQRP